MTCECLDDARRHDSRANSMPRVNAAQTTLLLNLSEDIVGTHLLPSLTFFSLPHLTHTPLLFDPITHTPTEIDSTPISPCYSFHFTAVKRDYHEEEGETKIDDRYRSSLSSYYSDKEESNKLIAHLTFTPSDTCSFPSDLTRSLSAVWLVLDTVWIFLSV